MCGVERVTRPMLNAALYFLELRWLINTTMSTKLTAA